MKRLLSWAATLTLVASIPATATIDGTGPNTWISIGVPLRLHQGSDGLFYLEGNDHGRCNNVRPTYFRFDMTKPTWKEMYSSLMLASVNEKPIDCVVDSGCGTDQVWTSYCRIPLR